MIDSTEDYPPQPQQPAPRVPDFELIRPIGQGGFGQVWLATNLTTGHLRAVKVISLRNSGATGYPQAGPAGREITSITRLEDRVHTRHPNLLDIQHVGQTAEHLFYVMEPADDVSGSPASAEASYRPATLQSRLESGPLPPEECERYAGELLTGLAHLHAAGMVHRDVKPANCLFVGGQLKLGDFGLVAEADPQVSRVGTQKYMPPDGRMDTRADVYAAGLVIYEMLTGLPAESFPRLGATAAEIAASPSLGRLNRLVLRACQPDARERFEDAREMLAGLKSCEPGRGGERAGSGRRMLAGAGAAGVLALAVWAGVWWWPDRTSPPAFPEHPARVHVNFITEPFEATIYLDGRQQLQPDGRPYTTPCTIDDLPAEVHQVEFAQGPDRREAGRIDFATVRQIEFRFGPMP
jgi:serine/threonine protein kinase